MQARGCQVSTPESKWKWKEIKHTELTPLTPCYQNKDWPWIIISGNQDVGRYCKALNCPRYLEDAKATELWFTVALAKIELQDGQQVVLIDEPRQVRRIRPEDLAVVFQTLQERKNDPFIYVGSRSAASKRKKAEEARELKEGVKKQKIDDLDMGNRVVMTTVHLWDPLCLLPNRVVLKQEDTVDVTQAQAIVKVEVSSVTEGVAAVKWENGETEVCKVKVAGEVETHLENISDSSTEGSKMEVHSVLGMNPDNIAANS
jgi:hypothetical protein